MSSNINIIKYNKSTSILFNSYSRIGTEVLSNLHQCKLSYEGKNFNSSEQLFFWLRLYGNPEYQELLLNNPFDFAEYLKDLKRKQQELYCYQQSLNGLKQAYKYGKIPEHIYKYVGIGNNIWGTARYGYNPKKTAKRRTKNKLKNR